MYAHNQDILAFSSLTKKDGQFLILRNTIKYENLKSIEGLKILTGRTGGMPLMSFKKALQNQNIQNVYLDDSVDFANLSSAFISGDADGVNLFEPAASTMVKNGYGYIATQIGTHSDILPYTTFSAKKEFIINNKDIIKKFVNGINKGLEYVKTHSSKDIANIIKNEFPDTSFNDLVTMIDNYKNADVWFDNYKIPKEAVNNLEEILIDNKLIDKKIPYKEIIYEIN